MKNLGTLFAVILFGVAVYSQAPEKMSCQAVIRDSSGILSGIDWSAGPCFLKIETDPSGGSNYTITGVSQILSVPYTLHSKTAETSIDAVKITGDQTIGGIKTFNGSVIVNPPGNPDNAASKAMWMP
jgi:hypothetical protein